MQKTKIFRKSLRNRLVLGVGFMLIPLMVIATGSYVSFERAVDTFEKSENKRLEELFPLDRLEDSLMRASSLLEGSQSDWTWQTQADFNVLSQEIDQNFKLLLNSPSQLSEKRSLVLNIQREWQEVKDLEHRLHTFNVSRNPQGGTNATQLQLQLNQALATALGEIRRLNTRLTNFQTSDNLKKADVIKQQVRSATLLTGTATVLIGLGAALFLARSILRPLNRLNKAVVQFGEGDLSHRIHLDTGDELEQLAVTINSMAEKLEHHQQALRELATIDGLTGVFNRREFNRRLTVELERSRRERHPVSLVMLDIDHFKKLNDTYGHQSGDDALRHISSLLQREVRPGDMPARYGGEEFAIILPYTDHQEAQVVAERLRSLIANQEIAVQEERFIQVTASLGCATFPLDAQNEEDLITAADAALYRAKRNGRNQVNVAGQSILMPPVSW